MTTSDRADYGAGTIIERKQRLDGQTVIRWRVFGVQPNGLPKRKAGSTVGTLKDARRDMAAVKAEIEKGRAAADGNMTVATLMVDYLQVYAGEVRPRTLQIATDLSRLHIVPKLGPLKLKAITPGELQRFHLALARDTKLERTRQQIQSVISGALAYAVRQELIPHSPAASVRVPQVKKVRVSAEHDDLGSIGAYDAHESRALIEVALNAGTVHSLAVVLALYTGLRRGECYGLQWADVLRGGEALSLKRSISDRLGKSEVGELKTDRSRRVLALSPKAKAVLETVRALQAREAPGKPWKWLFSATPDAMPQPGNVGRAFASLTKQANIRKLNFHALRHTFCSNAHQDGVPISEISRYMGHASEQVTKTVYLHLFEIENPAIMISCYSQPSEPVPPRLDPVPDIYSVRRKAMQPLEGAEKEEAERFHQWYSSGSSESFQW